MSRGIYYHPPPPFVGGQQPYAPRQMASQLLAVPENDPPFDSRRLTIDAAVGQLWQDAAVRWQPFQQRKLGPSEIAVPENDPPFATIRLRALSIIEYWWDAAALWQPFQQNKLNPSDIAVPENDPPFSVRRAVELQRQSWPYSYDLPILPRKFTHPTPISAPANDPPFNARRSYILQNRYAWPLGYLPPTLPHKFAHLGIKGFSASFPFIIASPIVVRFSFPSDLVDTFLLLSPIIQTEEW